MNPADVSKAADVLREARRVAVLTGAGVSAESGVPTFRGAGGLWEGRPIEDVATPQGFYADPVRSWKFYQERRVNLTKVKPNPAHVVLARWQDRFPSYALITQNVDGLHQAAGVRDLIELHGNIWRVRCLACEREVEDRTAPFPTLPPRCPECGGTLRPAVVWFGEYLPVDATDAAVRAAKDAEVLVVVGTSAVVRPAAGLIEITAEAGGKVIEVNPEPSALSHLATVQLAGPAGVVLPGIDALLEGKPQCG